MREALRLRKAHQERRRKRLGAVLVAFGGRWPEAPSCVDHCGADEKEATKETMAAAALAQSRCGPQHGE